MKRVVLTVGCLAAVGLALWLARDRGHDTKPAAVATNDSADGDPHKKGKQKASGEEPEPHSDAADVKADPDGEPEPSDPNGDPPKSEPKKEAAEPAPDADKPDDPKPAEPAPWEANLAREPEPHAWFRFEPLWTPGRTLADVTLAQWFEPAGAGAGIRNAPGRRFQLVGPMRLRAPWPEDTVLRLGVNTRPSGYQIYLYDGDQGVVFAKTISPREQWTAYVFQRNGRGPAAEQRTLAASDDNRAFQLLRNQPSPIELHWREGMARLVSGDITLVAAPLAGKPTDVYFDGGVSLYGIEMRRCSSSPPLPRRTLDSAQGVAVNLPDLDWDVEDLAETAELSTGDGQVRLVAKQGREDGYAFVAFDQVRRAAGPNGLPDGLYAVEMEVEGEPGVGVYLSEPNGRPYDVVRWTRNSKDDGRLSLCIANAGARNPRALGEWPRSAVKSVSSRHWLRLLASTRTVQWSASADGVHWASPDLPTPRRPPNGACLGLYHAGEASQLVIHQMRLVPFSTINAFGEHLRAMRLRPLETTRPSAPLPYSAERLDAAYRALLAWERIQKRQPQPHDWVTLYAGSWSRPPAFRRRLLVELSHWVAAESDTSNQTWLVSAMAELALGQWRGSDKPAPPFTWFVRGMAELNLPSGYFPHQGFEPIQRLIRLEQMSLAANEHWNELAELSNRLNFYFRGADPFSKWARSVAQRRYDRSRPVGATASRATGGLAQGTAWVEQIDKPAFNAMVELEGLIAAEDWGTAARLIAGAPTTMGLALHPDDQPRLLTLTTFVAAACKRHSELRAAMIEHADPIGRVYLDQAIEAGAPAQVQHVARRFPSTPTAGRAWMWLGDRALADGDWEAAVGAYEAAREQDRFVDDVESRLQLARSLGGRAEANWTPRDGSDWGSPLKPQQVRSVVEEVQQHARVPRPARPGASKPLAKLVCEPLGRLEAPFGRDPRQQVTRFVNDRKVDWFGRQLHVLQSGSLLIASNRFHFAAFDTTSGERVWQTEEIKDPRQTPQRSRDLSLMPCRMAQVDGLLVGRLLYGAGGMLVCANEANGELQWTRQLPPNRRWASDPVATGRLIWSIVATTPQDVGDIELALVVMRPEDGHPLRELPLGSVSSNWLARQYCQITATARGVIVTLDNSVFYAEADGLHWVRRRPTPPKDLDPLLPLQWISPPLLAGADRVAIHYPGLPLVEMLQVTTGERLWRKEVPGIANIERIRGGQMLVRTHEQLELWDDTGELVWSRPWKARCRWVSHAAGAKRFVCLMERVQRVPEIGVTREPRIVTVDGKAPRFMLQWRRWADGQVVQSTPIEEVGGKQPRLSHVTFANGHWWLFHGDGLLDATRSLVRLKTE